MVRGDTPPIQPLRIPPIGGDLAWRQELADMVSRVRLGGLFYIAGWLMIGLADEAPARYPLAFLAGALVFVVLGLLRLRRPPPGLDARGAARWIIYLWTVIWLSTGAWGAACAWLLVSSDITAARVLALVLIGAYGTAIAHALPMRAAHAGIAIGLLYVPQLAILLGRPGDRLLGVSFLIYFAYLLLVMRRSRAEYWQRVALEEQIREQRDFFEQQSRRDGLTGLPNRRRFDATLAALLEENAGADGTRDVSLVLFDLDHFKTINDRFGHAVGDSCLVEFARCLGAAFDRADELPARLGGEEFAVVLPRCGLTEATSRAETLRQAIAATPMVEDGTRFLITVSGGVVSATAGETCDALLARADVALYHAKRAGRDRIVATVVSDDGNVVVPSLAVVH